MMDRVSYLRSLSRLFLELRGSGLTLSPLDESLLRAWHEKGVPLELAARALRQGHASWSASGKHVRARPFSLRHAQRVLDELVGAEPRLPAPQPVKEASMPAGIEAVAARLEALADRLDGPLLLANDAALASLRARSTKPPFERLIEADYAQAMRYLRGVAPPERVSIVGAAVARAGPRGAATRRAHRATLRAFLEDEIRRRARLPRPSDLW